MSARANAKREGWKYRMCRRKIKHKFRESAAQHMREVYARTGDKLIVYYCELCGNYHVGHEKE